MSSPLSHQVRRLGLRASIAICTMLAGGPLVAREASIALPLYDTRIVSHAADTAPRDTAAPSAPTDRPVDTGVRINVPRPGASFFMIELPPDVAPGGTYKRPHHAFGYRWRAAEAWLRDRGFDAQTCYLPMMRLHTRFSLSDGASGTLWLYGRCTFK